MDEYYIPPNSNKARNQVPEKKEEVLTRPKTVKTGFFARIAELFSQRNPVEIANDTWTSVIKPTGKKLIGDSLHRIVDGMVYENGAPRYSSSNYTNYSGKKTSNAKTQEDVVVAKRSRNIIPADVEFDTEQEAIEKLQILDDIMQQNGVLRLSEFFEQCGYECPHTYQDYGWDDIMSIEIAQKANGKWRYTNIPRTVKL